MNDTGSEQNQASGSLGSRVIKGLEKIKQGIELNTRALEASNLLHLFFIFEGTAEQNNNLLQTIANIPTDQVERWYCDLLEPWVNKVDQQVLSDSLDGRFKEDPTNISSQLLSNLLNRTINRQGAGFRAAVRSTRQHPAPLLWEPFFDFRETSNMSGSTDKFPRCIQVNMTVDSSQKGMPATVVNLLIN